MKIRLGILVAILAIPAVRSEAGLITYAFTGRVTASASGDHPVDQEYYGFFTYYDDLRVGSQFSYGTEYYSLSDRPISISLTAGGETLAMTQSGPLGAEAVNNSFDYSIGVYVQDKPYPYDNRLLILLRDNGGDYGSTGLPAGLLPRFETFGQREFHYFGVRGDFLGSIETLTAVPEPSTLISGGTAALLGIGLAWRRRRRMKAKGGERASSGSYPQAINQPFCVAAHLQEVTRDSMAAVAFLDPIKDFVEAFEDRLETSLPGV